MSLVTAIGVGVGGAVGALLRALAGRMIRTDFPLATLLVNILGSFIISIVYTAVPATGELSRAVLASGFCGAFTTFSTFVLEVFILFRSGMVVRALVYMLLTVLLCCLASWGGIYLMS